MTTPVFGPVVALTYQRHQSTSSARFRKSKGVGASDL